MKKPQPLEQKLAADLVPGDMVEHKDLPNVSLIVVSGPHEGNFGIKYMVKKPTGEVVSVFERNLNL
ncbi:hypothetical protein [Pelotomaculum sp. FP]|uniref:hypothetical protein n=1 Tax=Pelotomaculum sp. FP TaxID=261474 RepID=UPI00106689E5|nr:hypothetical protein [Pelotomaculum sp. FP]